MLNVLMLHNCKTKELGASTFFYAPCAESLPQLHDPRHCDIPFVWTFPTLSLRLHLHATFDVCARGTKRACSFPLSADRQKLLADVDKFLDHYWPSVAGQRWYGTPAVTPVVCADFWLKVSNFEGVSLAGPKARPSKSRAALTA